MEIIWLMRIGICIVGISSTIMALKIPSIYGLWSMCSDLVYVILFPQLLMAVHFKNYCNTYGSLSAYIIAFIIRLSGGENIIGLPAYIHYPGYDKINNIQLFPYKTMAMLISLLTLIVISYWTNNIFINGKLSPYYDVFRCVINIPEDVQIVGYDPADPEYPDEQRAVLAGGVGKIYGSKNKANGCVNKTLGPDNDMKSDTIELISNDYYDGNDDVKQVNDNQYLSSCKTQLNTVF